MSSAPDPTAVVVEARTHGRVLVRRAAGPFGPTLIGFHGYAEDADTHLRALSAIPGSDDWTLVAVQALHPFYAKQQRIVASWMTSQDRELAIADNIDYVGRVLATIRASIGEPQPIVFAGFSQGAAMAYRAAATYPSAGVIILAGDVPPDVAAADVRLPPVLIGRGAADQWYTAEKHAADVATLAGVGAHAEHCVFDGGHEWSAAFYAAAGRFLATKITKTA